MWSVETEHPIAVDSVDHTNPLGTLRDNYSNLRFNYKLYQLYGQRILWVMDLGCSGGGFVKSFIDHNHRAIGLEGSDYSLIRKRAEWATIPDSLFTCDITWPFRIRDDNKLCDFDLVTAWDVLEHIPEERLPQVFDNIKKHLNPKGLLVTSISTEHSPNEFNGVEMHATIRQQSWWEELLWRQGFVADDLLTTYFHPDWVRQVSFSTVWRLK